MNRHSTMQTLGLALTFAATLAVQCNASAAATVASDVDAGSAPAVQAALQAHTTHLHAVKAVSPTHLLVSDGNAQGQLALYASADLTQPQPRIVRAVVVVHGRLRNADRYFQTMQRAAASAGVSGSGTLIVAPQFLAMRDVAPNHIPADVLRWHSNGWMAGNPAAGPAPVSSYAALDSLLAQLADRTRFSPAIPAALR
jgi:hypothetical protein